MYANENVKRSKLHAKLKGIANAIMNIYIESFIFFSIARKS